MVAFRTSGRDKAIRVSEPGSLPVETLRLHQANERTLLAWLRTGIALMAFGFAMAAAAGAATASTDPVVTP